MPQPLQCPCGQPISQPAKDRKRRYCSDACRRAADSRDRRVARPAHCQICGASIVQAPTGRAVSRARAVPRLENLRKMCRVYRGAAGQFSTKGAVVFRRRVFSVLVSG
jgi:hypothetical protein